MQTNPKGVLDEVNKVISLAVREGKASVVLDMPPEQFDSGTDSVFAAPDERVINICRTIKSVAEVVPSVPEHCKLAMDEAAHGSQIAGVFRQEDVWLCVAVDSANQLEIHAVLEADANR